MPGGMPGYPLGGGGGGGGIAPKAPLGGGIAPKDPAGGTPIAENCGIGGCAA